MNYHFFLDYLSLDNMLLIDTSVIYKGYGETFAGNQCFTGHFTGLSVFAPAYITVAHASNAHFMWATVLLGSSHLRLYGIQSQTLQSQ